MIHPSGAPLLSVLIPTKNRYETLVPVVEEICRRIGDDRLEIVVCDNSPKRMSGAIERLAVVDARVSYHYFEEEISIVENTERGIGLCRGDYLCFIGDDDLVSPHIMQVVDWLKSQDGDCLIYPPARYWWSGVRFARESRTQRPGVFWLPKDRDGAVRQLASAVELKAVLARGGVAYMNLPRLYHGIASRRSLDRVLDRFGKYVPGSSPDMALCIALALTTEHYLSIDYPVTVSGASRNSGGGWTAAGKHYGRIEDQRHLPRDILKSWDARLPQIWSEQIIYPQTIYEVMARAGKTSGISYAALYGSLVAYEPHILPQLWPILVKEIRKRPKIALRFFTTTFQKIVGRSRLSLRRLTGVGMSSDILVFSSITDVMLFMDRLAPPAATDPGPGERR